LYDLIGKFADVAKAMLKGPDSDFLKKYLRLFVDHVEVLDDRIVISGPKTVLAYAVVSTADHNRGKVPSYVAEWWARQGCINLNISVN